MFNKRLMVLLFGLLALLGRLYAQEKGVSSQMIEQYKTESKQLLQYLEDTFNFLGDSTQPVSEKEIIINQSYAKIFRDDRVQIEDDLDEERHMPLNKEVQAYMKDIMFFFKTVQFRFELQDVQQFVNDSGTIFFKITFNRNLKGIMVQGDTVNSNRIRYMEVNLNPAEKSLKIASIYTTKLNEKEHARNWWNNLSQSWKNYFGKSVLVYDTLPLSMVTSFTDSTIVTPVWQKVENSDNGAVSDTAEPLLMKLPDTLKANTNILYSLVKKLMSRETVDISNNLTIKNIGPLSELDNLRHLILRNTTIDDLTPVHHLGKLETLDVSGSAVSNLSALRYMWHLKELNFSKTAVSSIEPLSGLLQLERVVGDSTLVSNPAPLGYHAVLNTLQLGGCRIIATDSLTRLPALSYLDLSDNPLNGIDSIGTLTALSYLNLDSTKIDNIAPLASLKHLTVLRINHTGVSDLTPLIPLPALKIVYCDNSGVNREEALRFTKIKPQCIVVFNTRKLELWWGALPDVWKSAIKSAAGIEGNPSKITLHQLVHVTGLNLAGIKEVTTLTPVSMLYELESLDFSNTSVPSLEPLSQITSLRILKMDNTPVDKLEPLANLVQLKTLYVNGTRVSKLTPLAACKKLQVVYCNNTGVGTREVSVLLDSLPDLLVVFRSATLEMWWNNLDEDWQAVFRNIGAFEGTPSMETLHRLTQKTELQLKGLNMETGLEVLSPFFRLHVLRMDNCSFNDLSPLAELKRLKVLEVTNGPLNNLSGIEKMTQLDTLVLRNTAVDDLYLLAGLTGLKKLDVSGTKVGNLKPLKHLVSLKELNINNTRVKSLKYIEGLKQLELLKCYNTPIRQKKVDLFKAKHPMTVVVFY